MKPKVVIAGGTGFIGTYLQQRFQEDGFEVQVIARRDGFISWQDADAITAALENAALLINLAGKSVNCRYNKKNKEAIIDSRIKTTQLLGEAILRCQVPPKAWLNASTATIYRHATDKPMTEVEGEIGTGFSVDVATKWEKTFFDFELPQTRMIALRAAIVLGKEGGALIPYRNLVSMGFGGRQGNGRQMFSWIHEEDLYRIVCFLGKHENAHGLYNCAAPDPVSNELFMKTLRKVMQVKIGLPSPGFLLKLGALIIRTETELILKSRWVIPERLLQEGFSFKFPTIGNALEHILHPNKNIP